MSLISWQSIPVEESGDPLVDLSAYNFVLEPSYFNQGLSKDSRMFLRKSVADKLASIQSKLGDYRFKIWDGFRSREVQNNIYQKFWNELKTKNPEWNEEKLQAETGIFVTPATDPERIPPHATGGAVDLTLVDAQGKELDMGTVFDHFGPEAEPYYFESSGSNEVAKKNRKILIDAILAEDFCVDASEWWHFDYGNQKWALQLNRPIAVFGEAEAPAQ